MYRTPPGDRSFTMNPEGNFLNAAMLSLAGWIESKIREKKGGESVEPRIIAGNGAFCKIPYEDKLCCLFLLHKACYVPAFALHASNWSNSTMEAVMAWTIYKVFEECHKGNFDWRIVVFNAFRESNQYSHKILGSREHENNQPKCWESAVDRLAYNLVFAQSDPRWNHAVSSSETIPQVSKHFGHAVSYFSDNKEKKW